MRELTPAEIFILIVLFVIIYKLLEGTKFS